MNFSDIFRGFNTYLKDIVGDGNWGDTNARDQQIIALTIEVNYLSTKGTKDVVYTPGTAITKKDRHA